jgi:hypothetical protein
VGRQLSVEHRLQAPCTPTHCLHCRSEARVAEGGPGCRLQLLLLTEKIRSRPEDSPDGVMFTLFPINSLRNAALLAATTPMVVVVDSDLLLSRSMSLKMAQE